MKTMSRTTTAERVGRWLGRRWRNFNRQEARVIQWVVNKGLPIGVARSLCWIVKLSIFAMLMYIAFWLALLFAFAMITAWVARNTNWNEETTQTEWRYGPAGYGLYTSDGYRIDSHDSEEE